MYGWCPIQRDALKTTPAHLSEWLTQPYRLARALARHEQSIQLQLLQQEHVTLPDAEAVLLNEQDGLVRQIYLTNGTYPLTYGRTVIPQHTFDKYSNHFAQLGNKPIGDTLLYNNPDVTRSAFEFGYTETGSELFACVTQACPVDDTRLWGRRSLFSIAGFPLLIVEFFFPVLPVYHAE